MLRNELRLNYVPSAKGDKEGVGKRGKPIKEDQSFSLKRYYI